jgi:hypothetical protein
VGSYQGRGLAGSKNPGATSFNPGQPVVVAEPLDGGVGRSFGTLFENRFPDASIGLSLSIPIGNRAARAKGAIARATKRQAELGYAREEQRIATEVRVAVLALQTARQRIEAANAGLAAAETQFGAEKERFTAGLSTNTSCSQGGRPRRRAAHRIDAWPTTSAPGGARRHRLPRRSQIESARKNLAAPTDTPLTATATSVGFLASSRSGSGSSLTGCRERTRASAQPARGAHRGPRAQGGQTGRLRGRARGDRVARTRS